MAGVGGRSRRPPPAPPSGRIPAWSRSVFYLYAHHLGWSSGPVTLTFDVDARTVLVDARLTFEAD
jgi:hypothetical protein